MLLSLSLFSTTTYADSYAAIINGNSYANNRAEARNVLKQMYLKQKGTWPGDSKAQTIAQADVASHWISLKQKTGETPPRSVTSIRTILKLIGHRKGAFAIVDSETANNLKSNIKIFFSF